MSSLLLTFALPAFGRPPLRIDIADDSIDDIDALVNEFLDVTSEEERKEFFLVSAEIVDGDDAVLDWMKAFIERPFRVKKGGVPLKAAIEDVIERLENADTAFQNKCSSDPDALRALLYAHGATHYDEDLGKIESVVQVTRRDIIDVFIEYNGPIGDRLRYHLDEDSILVAALQDEELIEYNESYYRISE